MMTGEKGHGTKEDEEEEGGQRYTSLMNNNHLVGTKEKARHIPFQETPKMDIEQLSSCD